MSDAGPVRIPVSARDGDYVVHVGVGVVEALPALLHDTAPAERYALIADDRVFSLHGQQMEQRLRGMGLDLVVLRFPPGESSKSITQWRRLLDALAAAAMPRGSAVLALGGGVTTDLAGFVASTWMRGVPVVHVPTTILAMVDAAIGGKTGLNLEAGKNLVGSFHSPRAVVVDPLFAGTQTPGARAEGWVEGVKHGMILDADHLAELTRHATLLRAGDPAATARALSHSAAIKARVVSHDEHERGQRALLNYGHTVGHALERVSDWQVTHGRAVALGMACEARAAELDGITRPGTVERLREALSALGVDLTPPGLDAEDILAAAQQDKKARGGAVRYVCLADVGRPAPGTWLRPLEAASLRAALNEMVGG